MQDLVVITKERNAQLKAIKQYTEQNNIILVNEYIDRAKSATTDDRPAFLEMIEDAKKKKFNMVIVHKLDRFSRSRYDSAIYKMILKKNSVCLYSIIEHLDGSPESVILESVLEGVSEYYIGNLSREVMKGTMINADKCTLNGEHGLTRLMEKLCTLENEKNLLGMRIETEKKIIAKRIIDKVAVQVAVEVAKQKLIDGSLESTQYLINMFVKKVIVYKEHVEVYFNVLHLLLNYSVNTEKSVKLRSNFCVAKSGGDRGIRTPDLLLAEQTRCQLRYIPR